MHENYTRHNDGDTGVIFGQERAYLAALDHGDFSVLSFDYKLPSLPSQASQAMSISFTSCPAQVTTTDRSAEAKFDRLSSAWKEQTGHLSSVTARCTHPAYQQIIGMGEAAIPLILRDLKKTREDWFWALTAITGENPIRQKDAGRIRKMTEAWIKWGRAKGYDV